MPEISVIVPVYNVEKYLRNCLDTILDQTFSDTEIICVNDGSKDKSRDILEEYKHKDSRIKIIDKKNGGLSSARNAGLKIAQGKYISFIDSDDWVESTMLEKLYNSMESLNTDIAICGVHQYDESKKETDNTNLYFNLGYFDKRFDNRAFSYEETLPFLMNVCVMAWNKMYRKSFLDECHAWYPDGYIFEDGPFFFSIFFKTKKVSLVREFLYYYRINRKGSICEKGGLKFLDVIDAVEFMYASVKDLPDFEDIKYTFFRKKVEDIIFRFKHLEKKYQKRFALKLKNECSLGNEELFPPSMVRGKFRYNYFLFSILKTGNINYYELQLLKIKFMYKVVEILYKNEGVYTFKYKSREIKIKKHPKIFDIYYHEDKIHIVIMKKIKCDFGFKFSELEKFSEDD